MRAWSGRWVRTKVTETLASKGRVCHLCHEAGADSADHEPPRSVLIAAGVPDPDLLVYLWPAHLECNVVRRDREITDALRDELRRRRDAMFGRAPAVVARSPRFERARPTFSPEAGGYGKGLLLVYPSGSQEKPRLTRKDMP